MKPLAEVQAKQQNYKGKTAAAVEMLAQEARFYLVEGVLHLTYTGAPVKGRRTTGNRPEYLRVRSTVDAGGRRQRV